LLYAIKAFFAAGFRRQQLMIWLSLPLRRSQLPRGSRRAGFAESASPLFD